MAKERLPQSPEVSEDQLKEVLASLEDVKVPIRQESGSWSFWADRAVKAETRRTALREAEERYRHELAGDEERMQLQDRINRLRRQLGVA